MIMNKVVIKNEKFFNINILLSLFLYRLKINNF